ncbi:MAG TPA: amidohydrolase family protein [Acidimicrobiia bacterium]|nr:amidohydrolase family protein [Acidimicrobiia bacterium]
MANYDVVDADCHILEPPDIWKNWLPSRFQDKAPKLVKDPEGGDAWLTAVGGDPDPIGLVATPGMAYDKFRWFGVTYEEARKGCYNGEARLADMDIDGVDAEIIFPPQRTMSHFLGDDDDDFVLAGIEAYNNFLFEEFCAPDPKRLIGLAQIPSLGIDNAVDSLRKAKARGAKGVLISNWPAGNAGISRDDDPFWAAAVDEGIPVSVHINIISRAQRSASRKAAAATGNRLYDLRSEAARAKAIGGMSHVFAMTTGVMTDMIFTGVFERFPELQVCWIETGVGWIPHFLECLDDRWWRNRVWGDLPLEEPPSFYWHRNNAASFIIDHSGVELRNRVGVENMMWSSDYPHHGNDWPYSRKVIEAMMGGVSEVDKALIAGGNAARIWNLHD